jgi:hypothetical protein
VGGREAAHVFLRFADPVGMLPVWLVFSPKGWESSAQGTALGERDRDPMSSSPEGWERLSQPSGLQHNSCSARQPRAVPWAEDSQPFGLKRRHQSAMFTNTFNAFFSSKSPIICL